MGDSKPWKDESKLRQAYEEYGTQQAVSDEFGCSHVTIHRWMETHGIETFVERRRENLPYEHVAMFSGGHDSLVSTHETMEHRDGDVVFHIDTGTGIEKNQQYVEDVCEQFGWELEIRSPSMTLEEFAEEYGFPKQAAHSWIYRYLKHHPLSRFTTELSSDHPKYYTGVRRDESQRRMKTVTAEHQERDRWTWVAPIMDFTADDIETYIAEHNLPRNPVVENIGRSGECFCGAYADRVSELVELEKSYPDHAQWIIDLEERVQGKIGTDEDYCYWGSVGTESELVDDVIDGTMDINEETLDEITPDDVNVDLFKRMLEGGDMKLCTDCEIGGHR